MVNTTKLSLLDVLTKVEEAESVTPVVGAALRTERESVGMSVNELASFAAVSPGYVSMIENGKRTPTGKTLRSLYSVLSNAEGGTDASES